MKNLLTCDLVLVTFLYLAKFTQCQSPVYITNEYSQLITSSTLYWVTAKDGEYPEHAVASGGAGIAKYHVCRAGLRGGGSFHAGQLYGRHCTVVIGEQEIKLKKYQVLVNVDDSGRLEWIEWKQFSLLPQGTISIDTDIYAAKVPADQLEDNSGFLGGLYLKEKYGVIVIANGHFNKRFTSGQVLMEHEPVRFEFRDFFRGDQVSESFQIMNLPNQELLKNGQPGKTFNVTFERSIYFGKGHNIPTGIPVAIHFRNQTSLSLKWGEEYHDIVGRPVRLNYQVPNETSVHVTLHAQKITRKYRYTATVVTFYQDGVTRHREIRGRYLLTILDKFVPIYGEPRPLLDYRNRKQTTSTPATSTTTTTPRPTAPQIGGKVTKKTWRRKKNGKTVPTMIKSYRYPLKDSQSLNKLESRDHTKDSGHELNGGNTASSALPVCAIILLFHILRK